MNLLLFDINQELVSEWKRTFDRDNVEIMRIDFHELLKEKWDAIVSPANSFGIMDGGIDLPIRNAFPDLQANVTDEIRSRWRGYIPVGATDYVETGDKDHPWCIIAPTMEWPMPIAGRTIYGITRGILSTVENANVYDAGIETLAIPGLGTATGKIPPRMCAEYMALAWQHHKRGEAFSDWGSARPLLREIEKHAPRTPA